MPLLGSFLDDVVSADERSAVAREIRANWRHVGEALGSDQKFKAGDLDGFGEKENNRDCAQAMLDAWAQKHHKKATRRILILALKREDYGTLISDVFKCDPDSVQDLKQERDNQKNNDNDHICAIAKSAKRLSKTTQKISSITNEFSQLLQPAVTVSSRGVAEQTANELQETSFARSRAGIAQPSDAHDRYTPTVVSTRNFAPSASERNTVESFVRSPPQEHVSRPPQERVSIEPLIQPRAGSDPQVTAIFEAKYYHVERASDYFNERPFQEGGKRLGSGSFGTVYHGVLRSENGEKFEVAIKKVCYDMSIRKTIDYSIVGGKFESSSV